MPMKAAADFLQQSLQNNGHQLTPVQQEKMLHYLELMQQWNRVYNLTAITVPTEMIMLHVLDSLAIAPFLQGDRLVDVGSGAGLPGVPLALTHPEWSFVLIDCNHKKTAFLLHVITALKLTNVEVVNARVEDFHPDKTFDSILSRAFSSLGVMLQVSGHLANEHGQFFAMKGAIAPAELQTVPPGFAAMAIHPLKIMGLGAKRHLICVTKEREVNNGKNNRNCQPKGRSRQDHHEH